MIIIKMKSHERTWRKTTWGSVIHADRKGIENKTTQRSLKRAILHSRVSALLAIRKSTKIPIIGKEENVSKRPKNRKAKAKVKEPE